MARNLTKSGLGIALSRLRGFNSAKVSAGQYSTEPEIAAFVLWQAKMLGDTGKVSADLGAGTGILGLGMMLLGAQRVYFVENEHEAVGILKENIESVESEGLITGEAAVVEKDVKEFFEKADVVVMNPPFGAKVRKGHADKEFLEKAFSIAPVVYSFHHSATERFVSAISSDHGFRITHKWNFSFRLKKTMKHHRKPVGRADVSCYRMERQ
jgi:putative methylase